MVIGIISRQIQITVVLLVFGLFYPHRLVAEEEEGHKPCSLCHEMEGKEAKRVIIEPDKEKTNPYTGKPYGPVDGVCIRCHHDLIHIDKGHVLGIRPEKVKVPAEDLKFEGQEGELTCLSCHNPHPHETKYKYLRWGVTKTEIKKLCNRCHAKEAPRNHLSHQ